MLLPLNNDEQLIVIGQLGSPHGVKGWLKLHSYMQLPEDLLNYQPWQIRRKNSTVLETLRYEAVEGRSSHMLVLLQGLSDRNAAALYTLADIVLPRAELPRLSDNEYYWDDLVGLDVVNKEDVHLGKVDYLFETGSNDVLVIKGEKQHAIPYLMGDIVLDINLDKKVIRVDWDPDF